jgi:hypothetical protein
MNDYLFSFLAGAVVAGVSAYFFVKEGIRRQAEAQWKIKIKNLGRGEINNCIY